MKTAMANHLPLCLALLTWAGVASGVEMKIVDALRLNRYDTDLRPQIGSNIGPTKVNVSLTIHSLIVDETRQLLELSGDLLQQWKDDNLSFDKFSYKTEAIHIPATTGSTIKKVVWLPDLHVAQQVFPTKHGEDFLSIDSAGLLSWIQKIHLTFPCKLNLKSYPLRSHPCTLRLSSVGYASNEMEPEWNGVPPVRYDSAVVSHGYSIAKVKPTSKPNSLAFGHKTKRELHLLVEVAPRSGWAVKHTVIPMVATVTTAYLSFFINIRGVCARVIVCMMSLVTAAIFHESTYRKVPPAHDTMAIEVFTGTCLAFIFLAVVESVVVDVLGHFPTKGRQPLGATRNSFALEPDLTDDHASSRGQVAALWLDRCFRVLYPLGFLVFNAVYWVVYN